MTELAEQSLTEQLRAKRSEMMISELQAIALRLFEQRGFDEVTIEEVASRARISVRTFYRYFSAKEDLLQVHIDRRSEALQGALSSRPTDEPPLHALRLALEEVISAEDPVLLRCWISVVAATPSLLRGIIGGIQLKTQRVVTDFLSSRLSLPRDALVPTMLGAAVGGVIQAAHTRWFVDGGDLPTMISDGIEILENGIGSDPRAWAHRIEKPKRARRMQTR